MKAGLGAAQTPQEQSTSEDNVLNQGLRRNFRHGAQQYTDAYERSNPYEHVFVLLRSSSIPHHRVLLLLAVM